MLRIVFLSLVLFFTNLPVVFAEVIKDFSVEYYIDTDGVVEVTESINYDFEGVERQGIFRTIEKNHPQPATAWYKNRSTQIEVLSVTKDDLPVPFELKETKTELEIKIGDPDTTTAKQHIYRIKYKLIGALSYGDLGSEFYWNVTGNDWPVAILEAKGVVRAESAEIFSGTNDCYQGEFGNTNKCTDVYKSENTVVFTAKSLGVGEGLTIATGINPQAVAFLINESISYVLLIIFFSIIWLIFAGYKTYKFRTEYKVDLPVIAQYEPYQNYLPMYTGVLLDGRLDACDITAGILYLAEQGFIKIKKTEKKVFLFITVDDYEITLLRPVSEMPNSFLQSVSGLMFGFYEAPPKTVLLSSLLSNKEKNYTTIRSLENRVKKDITDNGFNVYHWPKFANWLIAVPAMLLLFTAVVDPTSFSVLLFLLIVPTIAVIIMIAQTRRTQKGYEVKNYLEGFKLFLSVTDKERFDFHNAPEKSPELFMEYLPYAVALGVEEKWAEVFADIAIPQPTWYDGGSVSHFSATALTKDIGVFSTTLAVNTLPGSGTSGSSGGGFSGGGGGRGGGGSW